MASGSALSTAGGGEIYVGSEIKDSFSLLDVVYANQFEGEDFDPKVLEQTEENFYRGAPPKWLNFHISEQVKSDGTRTPFIKRDGYDTLVEQIQQRRKRPGISTAKLFHQPGCGGTTLAMQVLWDLRKTFRSAVLTGTTSDITNVANEVVHLFTAGSRGYKNTVLLLVNDDRILKNLQESIMMKLAEQKVVTYNAVVILLCCVRKDEVLQSDHVVLKQVLSDTEQQKFNEKKYELSRRFKKKCEQFHGFNIMQTNFSQDYIQEACAVFKTIKRINKPKTQLVAILSLLNTYVPGSYLLESQCLDFLKHGDPFNENPSLEDRMKPFSELIITFQQDIRSGKKVRMAHPLIAQCCTELLNQAGATRSDIARNILTHLCRDEVPPFFLGFVKDMLTKREQPNKETKKKDCNSTKNKEQQDKRFSKLILAIQDIEKKPERCASVLKFASKKNTQDPFFPQALARFYYIELKDYNQAEMWAKRAMERDPQNSFVADTLGQIHKKHLKTKRYSAEPTEVLKLAKKAIEAFKHEEQLAENELKADVKENGKTRFSFFNTAGLFGYLEVCNMCLRHVFGDSLLKDLISRDEVKRKCVFLEKFLTYSKPNMKKDDPDDSCISECYSEYVGDTRLKDDRQKGTDFMQKLKQKLVDSSTGVPSFLDREFTESELKPISTWWEEIFLRSPTAREKPLSTRDTPELHLVTLLLSWPTDSEDTCVVDLSKLIQDMHHSYENTYEKYFQSRHLLPLFFMGKDQDLNRIVHRNVLERLWPEEDKETIQDWGNEKILQEPQVQTQLLQVKGIVQNYRVYATIGGKEIEVDANLQNSLCIRGNVSFFLGFTIRGPAAFGIQKTAQKDKQVSEVDISKPGRMKPHLSAWTDTTTGQHFVDRHQTALINRVRDTGYILDKLKGKGLISKENCEAVSKLQTTQDQMKDILKFVTSAGPTGKDALCDILKGMKSMKPLIHELQESGA